MTVRRIVTLGAPVLRKPAKKVSKFDKDLQELVQDMVETMLQAEGVGLAAPQVGVPQRVVVIQLPEDDDHPQAGQLFVLVNPEILSLSEEAEAGDEGCLSIPNIIGEVVRARQVTVQAQNTRGKHIQLTVDGFLARAFQHEIDHLDGVLFIDKVTSPDALRRVTPEGKIVPLDVPLEKAG